MNKKNQELSLDDLKDVLKSEQGDASSRAMDESSNSDASNLELDNLDPDTEDKQDLGNIESVFLGFDKE
jgi:hypothetical protein